MNTDSSGFAGRALVRIVCLLVCDLGIAACGTSVAPDHTPVLAGTYYVDCSAGRDGSGNEDSPWSSLDSVNQRDFAPGSQILFRTETTCTGTLSPGGSGADGAPNVIDSYGEGGRPIIDGDGAENAVYLENQQYWEIKNLEITNDSATVSNRRGVYVVARNIGQANHYRLVNLDVHDVKGDDRKDSGGSAGIMFEVTGRLIPTAFNDIVIDGCTIHTVDRTGITSWSSWGERPAVRFDNDNWVGWTNYVIRNNTLYDIGGDGIVVINATGALVEYNVVHDVAVRSAGYCVGIWAFNSDHTVFQHNEAYRVMTSRDGEGFDVDFGTTGTIFQYNYSHDNRGGFMLVCNPARAINSDAIIRYNVSQNDGTRVLRFLGGTVNTLVYNNTFYVGQGSRVNVVEQDPWEGDTPVSAAFYNNVVYNLGQASYRLMQGTRNVFDYNLFFGVPATNEPDDPHKLTGDPLLVAPGSGSDGIGSIAGYQLLSGSPANGSGMTIESNGGLDFWGNPVPQQSPPDRGAHQHSSGG